MGMDELQWTMDPSKYYERPEELPSIKEAFNDLALVDFEKRQRSVPSNYLYVHPPARDQNL